jgi:DNA-directed RNA polymerase specialized sigma24 family protein
MAIMGGAIPGSPGSERESRSRVLIKAFYRNLDERNGDESAFEELYRLWEGALRAVFHNLGVPEADIPDVVQEVMLKIMAGARFRERVHGGFTSFIYTVARHVWIDWVRKGRRAERVWVTDIFPEQAYPAKMRGEFLVDFDGVEEDLVLPESHQNLRELAAAVEKRTWLKCKQPSLFLEIRLAGGCSLELLVGKRMEGHVKWASFLTKENQEGRECMPPSFRTYCVAGIESPAFANAAVRIVLDGKPHELTFEKSPNNLAGLKEILDVLQRETGTAIESQIMQSEGALEITVFGNHKFALFRKEANGPKLLVTSDSFRPDYNWIASVDDPTLDKSVQAPAVNAHGKFIMTGRLRRMLTSRLRDDLLVVPKGWTAERIHKRNIVVYLRKISDFGVKEINALWTIPYGAVHNYERFGERVVNLCINQLSSELCLPKVMIENDDEYEAALRLTATDYPEDFPWKEWENGPNA